jgi:hypothetical protein
VHYLGTAAPPDAGQQLAANQRFSATRESEFEIVSLRMQKVQLQKQHAITT